MTTFPTKEEHRGPLATIMATRSVVATTLAFPSGLGGLTKLALGAGRVGGAMGTQGARIPIQRSCGL